MVQFKTFSESAMQRIGIVVFPGTSVITFSAVSVFELANLTAEQPVYELHILSEHGGPIRTSAGMEINTEAFSKAAFDTLIVAGGMMVEPQTPGMIKFVKQAPNRTRRLASICIGAFVLAEAGLLDDRHAATHWFFARDLQTQFPKVKVDHDSIFVRDGSVWTSAGMTAGIDLALALVEADLGADLARLVAKKMVVYHRRAGGQSQHSALLELEPKSDRIQMALTYAKDNLHTALTVGQLAEAARLSPRQFSRAFRAETGESPAKAIEHLRVEAARLLMERSRHPIDSVAEQTGFADRNRMRRAFMRNFGQPPQTIRRNAREGAPGQPSPADGSDSA
jgi:transcriptional regulator GlxA family with amidase domain